MLRGFLIVSCVSSQTFNSFFFSPLSISMSSADGSPVAVVPESVLKKRKRDEQWTLARKEQAEEAKLKSIQNRKVIFKRAEQYIKLYRQQVIMLISDHSFMIVFRKV